MNCLFSLRILTSCTQTLRMRLPILYVTYCCAFSALSTMAVHGTIPEFTDKDWLSYQERIGFYFEANDIACDSVTKTTKRRAILLSVIGSDTYTLLRSLAAPKSPSDLSYVELCKLLADHFQPKSNTILQRYNFYSAFRWKGQSINDFVANLKDLARTCDFGATKSGETLTQQMVLEDNLRDRFVCGIAEPAIQLRFLGETDLTFTRALEIALAMESAAADTAQLHTQPASSSDLHKLSNATGRHHSHSKQSRSDHKPDNSQSTKPCFRCGKGHSPNENRYKNTTCHYCKKSWSYWLILFRKETCEIKESLCVYWYRGGEHTTCCQYRWVPSLHHQRATPGLYCSWNCGWC